MATDDGTIDLLELRDVLDGPAREVLLAELRTAAASAALVHGQRAEGTVDTRVRKAARLVVEPETRERIRQRFLDLRETLAAHFGVVLTDCEVPQFLRYETGDFFVAHQDGNTPLIRDDSRFRKVSVVLFLSTAAADPVPDSYGGGALVLYGPFTGPELRLPLNPSPGTLVAFRAETTHEVTPVTHGERYTVVTWFR